MRLADDAFDPIVAQAAPRPACRWASPGPRRPPGHRSRPPGVWPRPRTRARRSGRSATRRDDTNRSSHSIIGRPLTGTRNFGVLVCRREPAPAAGMIRIGSAITAWWQEWSSARRMARAVPRLAAAGPIDPVRRARQRRPLTSAPSDPQSIDDAGAFHTFGRDREELHRDFQDLRLAPQKPRQQVLIRAFVRQRHVECSAQSSARIARTTDSVSEMYRPYSARHARLSTWLPTALIAPKSGDF